MMGVKLRRLLLVAGLFIFSVLIGPVEGAHAATVNYGAAALNWAEVNATGDWYVYGADGPSEYDCSGLVSTAVQKADGFAIGRDTYEMLDTHGNGHLVQTENPRRGSLVFIGTGHVEFYTVWSHMTFGAHDTGTRIGWLDWYSWPAGTTFWNVV
jgi:hypothetical protein